MVEIVGSELLDVGGVGVGGVAVDGVVGEGSDPPAVSSDGVAIIFDPLTTLLNGSKRSIELRMADLSVHRVRGGEVFDNRRARIVVHSERC